MPWNSQGVLSQEPIKHSTALRMVGRSSHSQVNTNCFFLAFCFIMRTKHSNLLLKNLYNGWALLPLCIDLRPQTMQFTLLLLLAAPLAGLAAPIEKPSSPRHLDHVEELPDKLSPTCYCRWRHRGHLTFRLARLLSCSGHTDQQDSSANTNVQTESVPNRSAIAWVG